MYWVFLSMIITMGIKNPTQNSTTVFIHKEKLQGKETQGGEEGRGRIKNHLRQKHSRRCGWAVPPFTLKPQETVKPHLQTS